MTRRQLLPTLLLSLVLLALGPWICAPPTQVIRFIPDPQLQDVAATDPTTGEIRFNPIVALRLPAPLVSFLYLHEQGHIALRHRVGQVIAEAHRQELAADCWASRRATPAELAVARAFFTQLGDFASDTHPSGAQRAAEILRCGR